ncbi:hypothetical protein ACNAN0_04780 [Agrilactobacillus fermenti]|uniref:hypothetical protein n=1 Tax=Agrilactobacillus fermenti TaxID=2586909 RepID=UPI001E2CDABF|nr:hypothetical protein [Agrilactobacillus fermenti]MCD2256887.1 hypothetical protein [Agrilactobacillus fermenti]
MAIIKLSRILTCLNGICERNWSSYTYPLKVYKYQRLNLKRWGIYEQGQDNANKGIAVVFGFDFLLAFDELVDRDFSVHGKVPSKLI